MPSLVLHPRVAPAGRLRVWLGVFDADTEPPNVDWRLNGAVVQAEILRPFSAAHIHGARTYTGVFELAETVADGTTHRLQAVAFGDRSAELTIRPVPANIPSQGWARILLTSCYHQAEDRAGLTSRTYDNIPSSERPDLTLLMGDQVYLDLPTLNNYPDNEAALSAKFEAYYRKNWTSSNGLARILSAAPSVSCPDDHEYWNNFPHRSPIIQNSWRRGSQIRWKNAADQAFDAFQVAAPAQRGDNIEIDFDILSIIVLDQRTHRRADRTSSLARSGLGQVEAWADRLIAEGKFGAVVTGQSLLDKPVSRFTGTVADWMLPNYADYEPIVKILSRLADAGRPVLLLTGDVHWGRVTAIKRRGRTQFYEIVCSPTSLVSTIGADQLGTIGAGFRRFFRSERERWPRHNHAPDAEPFFAPQVFGKTYSTETIYKHRGDQLAMLALRRAADTLEARITYYEINKSPKRPKMINLGLLRSGT